MRCDVAIIGGGPAGSTVGSLLRKYNEELEVVILEREQFPRDHVGESHLPAISDILNEMGVWDKVEAAEFPIKIGGTYRWGRTDELWDFEFLPGVEFRDEPRPAKFEGQRRMTAFQVDRSIYDKILLDHAASLGCKVCERVKVKGINRDEDRVMGLAVAKDPGSSQNGLLETDTVEAKYYVDCSGETGILRRAMGVEVHAPTALRNIAIWDYWNDAEWAVSIGRGGTRIQIMSIKWGWLWFIPITATRTSIGLVLPGEYYKASGKTKEEILRDAIAEEPLISHLTRNAKQEGHVQATKDWNFISDRISGENWFLAGDACGFADPILSAGMTLAHTGARKVAFSILSLLAGENDPAWVREQYESSHRGQVRHHMQFADYWYSANGRFTDLQEYCTEIAKTAGLKLNADDAFRWLATGGFTLEHLGSARALSYRLGGIKFITGLFSGDAYSWEATKYNRFKLNLEGAEKKKLALYDMGKVAPINCFVRGEKTLPLAQYFNLIYNGVLRESDSARMMRMTLDVALRHDTATKPDQAYILLLEALESMIVEGWIDGEVVPDRPFLAKSMPAEAPAMHPNRDNVVPPG